MPSWHKWVDGKLLFQPTGANIKYILDNWPEAEWLDGTQDLVDVWMKLKMQEQNTREEKKEQLIDESGYEYQTVPFAHQRQAFLLGRTKEAFAYLHEQGLGKTKVCLDDFAYQWEHDLVDVLLLVAPNGVHSNWIINEVPAHLPERLPVKTHTFSAGMSKPDLDLLRRAASRKLPTFAQRPQVPMAGAIQADKNSIPGSAKRPCLIVAFNVEGFVSKKACQLFEEFLANYRCMVAVDESNTIQNPSAVRTKFLIKTSVKAKYRRILNGTPITNGVENLFAQFKFLDPRILGYTSFTSFKAQYCIMGGFQFHDIVGYKHIQELSDIIDGHSHRALKKDCLDLPAKMYKKHFFEMTPTQKVAYETVRKAILKELEELFGTEHGRKLAKEISISRMIRLQQISCGWVPHTVNEPAVPLHGGNRRLDALLTLLCNVEKKAIIWVNGTSSRADIHLIKTSLCVGGYNEAVEYHGGIKDRDREIAIDRFQNHPNVQFFLASKAAAVGLTLTAADQAFYYSNNFDLRIRLQSEDRNHRIGSEVHESILYTDIFTSGIDKKIVSALREKKSIADQITRDPISLFME
jgi:hypothetical protein